MADLAIDLFVPGALGVGPSPLTTHQGAAQTNFMSAPGNHAGEATFGTAVSRSTSWFLLARVEVVAPANAGTIVAFGDSITDGTRSTPTRNNRWPDHLAAAAGGAARRPGAAASPTPASPATACSAMAPASARWPASTATC